MGDKTRLQSRWVIGYHVTRRGLSAKLLGGTNFQFISVIGHHRIVQLTYSKATVQGCAGWWGVRMQPTRSQRSPRRKKPHVFRETLPTLPKTRDFCGEGFFHPNLVGSQISSEVTSPARLPSPLAATLGHPMFPTTPTVPVIPSDRLPITGSPPDPGLQIFAKGYDSFYPPIFELPLPSPGRGSSLLVTRYSSKPSIVFMSPSSI